MKNLSLITAGLLAVGLVSAASATETLYITGSSAYRGNVNNSLKNDGTALGLDSNTSTVIGAAYSTTASSLVFSNTISGGTPILIKTAFTGSEAGIASLLDVTITDPTPGFPAAPLKNTPLPTFLSDAGTSSGTGSGTHAPDIAMADTSQTVSLTKTPALTVVGNAAVGIVQFVWMKGTNNSQVSYAHLQNLTLPQLNVLLSAGQLDLSFFTGVSDDFGTTIKLVGRNFGSGTRVNCLIETLYGVGKSVSQYAANPTYAANGVLNTPSTVTSLTEAQFVNIGNDGYDSGGGVAAILGSTGSFTCIPVGYIGLVDATSIAGVTLGGSAITGSTAAGWENGFFAPSGGQFLTLNGVAYSDQAIINGAYDYYGHEHMLVNSSTSQADGITLAGKLFTDLQNSLTGGINGIPIADLYADRPADADSGFVTPLYTAAN
jgi:hypothetical protein